MFIFVLVYWWRQFSKTNPKLTFLAWIFLGLSFLAVSFLHPPQSIPKLTMAWSTATAQLQTGTHSEVDCHSEDSWWKQKSHFKLGKKILITRISVKCENQLLVTSMQMHWMQCLLVQKRQSYYQWDSVRWRNKLHLSAIRLDWPVLGWSMWKVHSLSSANQLEII